MIWEFLIAIFVGFVAFIYKRWNRYYYILEDAGIPFDKPFLCFGSGPWALHKRPTHEIDMERLRKFKAKTCGFIEGSQPVIQTIDPDVIKAVFVKEFEKFQDKPVLGIEKDYATLDVLNGEVWHYLRRQLTPVLSSGKIKSIMKITEEVTDKASEHIKAKVNGSVNSAKIEVQPFFGAITMEVIMKATMSIPFSVMDKHKINTDHEVIRRMDEIMSDFAPHTYIDSAFFLLFQFEPDLSKYVVGGFIDTMKCKSVIFQIIMFPIFRLKSLNPCRFQYFGQGLS